MKECCGLFFVICIFTTWKSFAISPNCLRFYCDNLRYLGFYLAYCATFVDKFLDIATFLMGYIYSILQNLKLTIQGIIAQSHYLPQGIKSHINIYFYMLSNTKDKAAYLEKDADLAEVLKDSNISKFWFRQIYHRNHRLVNIFNVCYTHFIFLMHLCFCLFHYSIHLWHEFLQPLSNFIASCVGADSENKKQIRCHPQLTDFFNLFFATSRAYCLKLADSTLRFHGDPLEQLDSPFLVLCFPAWLGLLCGFVYQNPPLWIEPKWHFKDRGANSCYVNIAL